MVLVVVVCVLGGDGGGGGLRTHVCVAFFEIRLLCHHDVIALIGSHLEESGASKGVRSSQAAATGLERQQTRSGTEQRPSQP